MARPQVDLAVLQLRNPYGRLLRPGPGLFLHRLQLGPELLVGLHLVDDKVRQFGVPVEELLDLASHPGDYLPPDVAVPQLVLRLALEHGVLQLDGDGGGNAVAYVVAGELLGAVGIYALENTLLESREVGASGAGVLTVGEGEVAFAVRRRVGEGELQCLLPVVDHRIDDLLAGLVLQKVLQPVLRLVCPVVVLDLEPGVQEGVVQEPSLDELIPEGVAVEYLWVGNELNVGAVLLCGVHGAVIDQFTLAEHQLPAFAVAEGPDQEVLGKGIHRLGSHTVQPHAEHEYVGVVLGPGVYLGNALHELAQGDPPAVVPHRTALPVELHPDPLTVSHDELVDGVVDHFLEKDVDAVVEVGAVAQPAYVHPRSEPDVLYGAQGLYLAFIVFHSGAAAHSTTIS